MIKINEDLYLYRHENGVKLHKPIQARDADQHGSAFRTYRSYRISNLFEYPANLYFVNNEFRLVKINSECAENCGFDSETSDLGKKASDFFSKDSASLAVRSDDEVMSKNKIMIYEQTLIRQDGAAQNYLSIKSPWYDDQNKIIGVFGCSIAIGLHSLSKSLAFISDLGLLNTIHQKQQEPLLENNCVPSLSKQQFACAKILLLGRTSKEIAQHLRLSHRTVDEYIAQIKRKLNCRSKTELVLKLAEFIRV